MRFKVARHSERTAVSIHTQAMNDDDETYIFVVCSKALFVES